MHAELSFFAERTANKPLQPLQFQQIVEASSSIESIAQLVREELPVRFAERIKHIEKLVGWERIPQLVSLHAMHLKSFRDLRLVGVDGLDSFTDTVIRIRQRHKKIIPIFAEAVKNIEHASLVEPCESLEARPSSLLLQQPVEAHTPSQNLERWVDKFLLSRISTEVLMSHFVACTRAARDHQPGDSAKVGIVDTRCDPSKICLQAVEHVEDGVWPCTIDVENPGGHIEVCQIPRYVFYIVEEVLRNSARAASERSQKPDEFPIKVTVCANKEKIVIRISDRGGGVPFSCDDQMWSYWTSTAQEPAHINAEEEETIPEDGSTFSRPQPWGVFAGQSPLRGRGLGLPLSRLYAMYLGGALEVINLPGVGVDAYLFLKRIESPARGSL